MKNQLLAVAEQVDLFIKNNPLPNLQPSYLEDATFHLLNSGGKRIRPALLLWFAQMTGSSIVQALPVAAAAEVFHTWTLVHDDIIDRDETRRGQASTHASLNAYAEKNFGENNGLFGQSMAILTGDLQQAWVQNLIIKGIKSGCSSETILAIIDRLNSHLTPKLIHGEAVDVEFEYRPPQGIGEVFTMMENKTGILLEFCAQAGTLIGMNESDFDLKEVQNAGTFARNCGIAFQLQDDILGVFADKSTLGKPLGSDLCCGKQTALILETRKRAEKSDVDFLTFLIGQRYVSQNDLARAREIISGCGALEAVTSKAKSLVTEALGCLFQFPENEYREYLTDLGRYMVERTY